MGNTQQRQRNPNSVGTQVPDETSQARIKSGVNHNKRRNDALKYGCRLFYYRVWYRALRSTKGRFPCHPPRPARSSVLLDEPMLYKKMHVERDRPHRRATQRGTRGKAGRTSWHDVLDQRALHGVPTSKSYNTKAISAGSGRLASLNVLLSVMSR